MKVYRQTYYQGEKLEIEQERSRQKMRRKRSDPLYREAERLRKKERYYSNHDQVRKYYADRYWKDPEKSRSYARDWYRDHKIEILKRLAERKQKDRKKFRKYDRDHYWRNVDRSRQMARIKSARRRHRFIANGVEPVDIEAIIARDGLKCHICGLPVKRDEISLDHLIPISKGGPHASWNLAISHRLCNYSRSDKGDAQLRLPVK